MNENKNIFGIIYILIAMALFSVHDAILKYIFEKTSLYEIFFARTLIAALLSGGFLLITKQRISLIREILLEPDILILDEATSALDNVSLKKTINFLNKIKNKTTLIIFPSL